MIGILKKVAKVPYRVPAIRYLVTVFRTAVYGLNTSTPIIVYQMGKVGSSAVYHSLRNAGLPNPIYQVHHLSHNGIRNAEQYYQSLRSPILANPMMIRGKTLRKKLDKGKASAYKIITLVRDPIRRDISNFFQNIESFWPDFIDEMGDVKRRETIKFLQEKSHQFDESTDYVCRWFDEELKATFNVDVFAYPFNYQDGFAIIREGQVEVLVLRLEDLDRNWNRAIAEFLGLEAGIKLVGVNIAKDKKYYPAYQYVMENIALPRSVLTKIYSSRFAKHFYSRVYSQ